MKIHTILAIAATLLTAVCARADLFSVREPFSKTAPFNADGTVTLENVNGNVEVMAWDRNEIKIEGEKSAKTEEELRRIDLTIEQSAEHASIKVHLPKRTDSWFGGGQIRASVKFTLTVPAGARLDEIKTVNGSVAIHDVRGRIHASSVNGRVRVTGTADTVEMGTVNGGIDAEVAVLPPGSTVNAHSVNGGVSIALPQNVSAVLNASTVNGGVHSDFPAETSGHFISRRLHGTVGNGDADVKASTVNGGVHIRRI
jgi:DUF4097 and DUF4098 domain-containing protein YvlB